MMIKNQLNLKGFNFQELHSVPGLQKLDEQFLSALRDMNHLWYSQLLSYRQNTQFAPGEVVSQLLIDCAVVLEGFISQLFGVEEDAARLQAQTLSHQPIFAFRAYYVLKQARRVASKEDGKSFLHLNQIIESEILSKKLDLNDRQLAVAQLGMSYLQDVENCQERIAELVEWCVAAMNSPEGREAVKGWEMFKLPKRLNFENLVEVQPLPGDPFGRLEGIAQRYRDGFELTDSRMSQRQFMWEVDYCVYCHENQGDFCSRGFLVKKNDSSQGLKINTAGETLIGCPLEEKISEMHVLKKAGFGIAALAMIMVDNPLCPMTGHRICNDCMKACIYQKQEPVNIPQTETGILTDVLNLPWGVEIYDLMTRWNPLRPRQWLEQPYNGLKVLVMGMGPAGFSLAHHLLMEGFAVTGMDGLKIEPLPEQYLTQPIYRYADITESLAERLVTGFGGVAEYGITVRWDKNFLKLIYISLLRRQYFQVLGGIRFGGTLKVEEAWALGFDHLALAVGAGLPEALTIPNSLAPGMRQANDFLMALQLTGAAKADSLANLQVRLPAVVIGGGLTAVDTATEVQAYYLVQIEKMARRYHSLINHFGEDTVRSRFLPADLTILDEFLFHAKQLSAERERARKEQRQPDLISLLRGWGGVTIVYRRRLQESPAYRRNHEELVKALEEGIYYAEGLEPRAVLLDDDGQVRALRCQWSILDEEGRWVAADEQQALPARSIFVATGTRLNVAYEFEHRGTFLRKNHFEYRRYERVNGYLRQTDTAGHVKSPHFGAFTSYSRDHRLVTFLGDTHPIFQGSVVKAIASAQRVYPEICELLASRRTAGDINEYQTFRDKIRDSFTAVVEAVVQHNARVTELVVRAPVAARNGGAGQFYRVQNFGSPQMESLALLGVPHVQAPDLLSFYVIEKGASSRLVRRLQPGDPLALMGPTGAHASRAIEPATILVIGDIISPAFLLSMAEKFRNAGHRVWYVGYFDRTEDIYCREKLEAIAEKIIWLTAATAGIGSAIKNALEQLPDLSLVRQVWTIGSSCLLNAVQAIRAEHKNSLWPAGIPVQASVYGPMQCMLKGVCAQCLQWQINPATGARSKAVYACSWQHQPLDSVDIHNLDERLSQNRCQETLTDWWVDYLER
jgi:NADPH-dependent glutamate synthase beta subunit-like oxidoreductase/NAD(P)H-flavin reductase